MIPFFLGTCRTHEPAIEMRKLGVPARLMPSRVHTPMQILQMVRFLNGEAIYTPATMHLLSDYTIERMVKDNYSPVQVFDELVAYRELWAHAEIVFIEISTLREYFIVRREREFFVNTYTRRDLELYSETMNVLYESGALTRVVPEQIIEKMYPIRELKKIMQKIKSYIPDKKIVWLSHIRPTEWDEALNKAVETRYNLAKHQSEVAREIGDLFYDPSSAINEIGNEKFFRNNGEDINHLSEAGKVLLAKKYIAILRASKETIRDTKTKLAVFVSNPCINDSRVLKMAAAASEKGYEVKIYATAGQNLPNEEMRDGFTIIRNEWKPVKLLIEKSFLLRFLNFISRKLAVGFAKRIVPFAKYFLLKEIFANAVKEYRPDIIHAHDLICLPAACTIAHEINAKVVYDAHEYERYRFPKLNPIQFQYVSMIEKKFAACVSAVVTVGDIIGKNLKNLLNKDEINIIYNSPRIGESDSNLRQLLGLTDDEKIILYVGKVSKGRGIEQVLKALALLPDDYHLVCLGHTVQAYVDELIELSKQLRTEDRFLLLQPVKDDVLVDFIRSATVGVIPVEPLTLSYRYCMPNKLFELSFANVPIVANKLDNVALFLNHFKNGVVVDFLNPDQLAKAIESVSKNRGKYILSDEIYNEMSQSYSWDVQKEKLLQIYANVLHPNK